MELLKNLCAIQASSGNEEEMTHFVLNWIQNEKKSFLVEPQIFSGGEFQQSIALVFGEARTAVFAHLDSIGFTVRYNNELVKIGSPRLVNGYRLFGKDSKGEIECHLKIDKEGNLSVSGREIERGTILTFKPDFRESENSVQCCTMDNRLGVWNALQLAKTMRNGAIAFSCREEHQGGNAAFLGKFLYENFKVRQALISDITWVTEGVHAGEGVAISLRDSGIPNRSYVNRIISLAKEAGIAFQLEVEGSGGSDGNELQKSPYPWDWCFVGAAEDNVHSPDEKVHKKDIESMLSLYKVLIDKL
jgi:putative aminopeptidase FrvX